MNEYQLRKSYLEVGVHSQTQQRVAYLKINLYLIATGPFHINLAVDWGTTTGRISFDLKMSQIINLQVASRSALIELARSHPGEYFSYSIKTIVATARLRPATTALVQRANPAIQQSLCSTKKSKNKTLQQNSAIRKICPNSKWYCQGRRACALLMRSTREKI